MRTGLMMLAASAGLLGLAGSAMPQPAPPPSDRCGGIGADWSDRRKVVHLAVCEWSKFGYPVVEIRPASRAEEAALPASLGLSAPLRTAAAPARPGYEAVVPAVEMQTRFGKTEDDFAVSPLIEGYWSAVRPNYVAGVREMRRVVDREQRGWRAYYPGWWEPWSAAFTSWTLQTAGVDWFRGSASHVGYLKAAPPGRIVAIDRYKPLPGDLVCAPRADAGGEPTAVSVAAFLEGLKGTGGFETHCDVVVRVNPASVVVIGGNVKNSVAATVVPLRRGRMLRTTARPWAAALTMTGGYDPCARMESVPLKGWEASGVERKRQLGRTGCRLDP